MFGTVWHIMYYGVVPVSHMIVWKMDGGECVEAL
jgi:tryptophan-rich sensory protein